MNHMPTTLKTPHMYYMCETRVLQVYELHAYYTKKHHTCITCVKHMYYRCMNRMPTTPKTPHMYYMCETLVLQVYESHVYYT